MKTSILVFTDTNNNVLLPSIMQTHPGLRETLAYLDFTKYEIPVPSSVASFNLAKQSKLHRVVCVIIVNPDPRAYPRIGQKFSRPSPDEYRESFTPRKFVEKDIFSSYWIQTFIQERRHRLRSFVDAPPMRFATRSVNGYA